MPTMIAPVKEDGDSGAFIVIFLVVEFNFGGGRVLLVTEEGGTGEGTIELMVNIPARKSVTKITVMIKIVVICLGMPIQEMK